MLKKNQYQFALRTLISGFILHFILGTFHLWQTLLRYFNSYLLEFNNVPIPDKYLEIIVRDNVEKQERKFTISLHTDVIRTI